ncbi:uncharacterized protein [Typha latifolia]|uniref:uncharacterized protein n=1 Tax=Typha latifolia TaxID=4733 RepID=UPI003C2E0120
MLASSLQLRRFLCCSNGASPAFRAAKAKKTNIVFLGSPQVAANVLDKLLDASKAPDSIFEVAAIVTQPPAARDRGRKVLPSAVAQLALERGFPQEFIFTPKRAGEATFLSNFRALNPEVCILVAYGNLLPKKFLEIPQHGTVNIHPSLLPQYRGAAPVQRALQDGVTETGVSLLYTVLELDAGPIIANARMEVDDCIKAPELLEVLFDLGSDLLFRELPSICDGSSKLKAQPQDGSKATLAEKITSEESWLSFDLEAKVIHNKVRAFAGWPGTRARVQVIDKLGQDAVLDIKIISTRVCLACDKEGDENEILFSGSGLLIPCAGQSWLEVLELQLPGKKVMTGRDFWNGLRGQKLKKLA